MDINRSSGEGGNEEKDEEKDHFSSWCSEDIMFSNMKMHSETCIVLYKYESTNIEQSHFNIFSCFPFKISIDICNYFT